jgi:hypothetical protein
VDDPAFAGSRLLFLRPVVQDTGGEDIDDVTDKDRQRQRTRLAPHGRVPNWLLVVVAGAVSAMAAVLAGSL